MISIAQISDTHLLCPVKVGETDIVKQRINNLKRCVDSINNLDPQPDIIIHTGDVTQNGTVEEYKIAASILDYLSFTSGDGFEFFGNVVIRVKGYSNEPSSTIVHYLAPAGFAFFYYRTYRLLGIILLLFSLICISSLIGIIAIALSFLVYFILSIKRSYVFYKLTNLFILIKNNKNKFNLLTR